MDIREEKKSEITKVSISTETIVRVFGIILILVALFYLRDLVLVILTSIVIASFVESAVLRLRKWKFPRALTVSLVYVTGIGILFGIFYLFAPLIIGEVSALIKSLQAYIPNIGIFGSLDITSTLERGGSIFSQVGTNASLANIVDTTASLVSTGGSNFVETISHIFGGLLNVFLIVVISFYLSLQEKGIEAFLRIVTPRKHEMYVIDLWQRTERKIGLWMQGQMLLGLIVGVLVYIGLSLLSVPYAFVIALLAGLFEIVPFGIFISIIPAVGLAYVGGGTALLLKVLALFIIVIQIENYILGPLIVKRVVGISPIVVILSVLVGAKLASFWGVILAVPVSVFLFEYINDMEKRKDSDLLSL